MKFDSPFFDRIRVKPDEERQLRMSVPSCNWPGCQEAAPHRAPKGRGREREYWRFCLEHAREYNQSYNYFKGMTDDEILRYQRDALVGHRPTWKMGQNGALNRGRSSSARFYMGPDDPFDLFGENRAQARENAQARAEARAVRNAERRALETMGLEMDASTHDIKARFKALVKRHHPDANGGDRSSEDKLREIIQAYNYLKSQGFR